MNTKIQELTDLIYNEGVVKGQQEADKVISEAQAKADKILLDARQRRRVQITLITSERN